MERITSLNDNDILLGKGSGYHEYVGNQRFLALVEERKGAYNSAAKNKEKSRLAKEFLDHIHSIGGRFLKREDDERVQRVSSVIENGVWYEIDEVTALDKIKQAFRQNRDYKRFKRKSQNESKGVTVQDHNRAKKDIAIDGPDSDGSSSVAPAATAVNHADSCSPQSASESPPLNGSRNLLPLISLGNGGCPMIDYSNLFSINRSLSTSSSPFGSPSFAVDNNANKSHQNAQGTGVLSGLLPPDLYSRYLADAIIALQSPTSQEDFAADTSDRMADKGQVKDAAFIRDRLPATSQVKDAASISDRLPTTSSRRQSVSREQEMPSTPPLAEDDASCALYALSLADRPRITDEELESEKSSLTEEEQEGILCDLFGKQCSIELHRKKKVRRDFDIDETLSFLLHQMRAELNSIPEGKKRALLEAQTKCQSEEFSDSRLKQFLRADGMNPKLAAQRFVNYWESRRDLFGTEKYHQRMTLSEALRDDLVALQAGVFSILPRLDVSGRPLVFLEAARNTGKGYTAKSLVRSVWYLMEIMVREYAEADGNFVWILWDKSSSSIWQYDHTLISHVPYYHRHCWPIREMPTHSCCSSVFLRRIVRPVLVATMGKEGRCRLMIHDVPENEIVDTLAEYGIAKECLPSCMGGSFDLDTWLSEFVAQRRAIEMEEL